jgi:hypothetical protein
MCLTVRELSRGMQPDGNTQMIAYLMGSIVAAGILQQYS